MASCPRMDAALFYLSFFLKSITMSVMQGVDDNQIIEKYLSGDEKSFDLLVEKYFRQIYNFVFRLVGSVVEAEDLTQEVFVKAWKRFGKYDREKKFKTWLFVIARNSVIDLLRKKKEIPLSKFEDEEGNNFLEENLVDIEALPNELFERQELQKELQTAIDKLSPKEKSVVLLYYQEQLSFREISEIFGESINTIKSRYQRSLIKLRRELL